MTRFSITTALGGCLLLGLVAASLPAAAAITWTTGGQNGQSKQYQNGYETGRHDCKKDPVPCGVNLEDVVDLRGWGETEPNDAPIQADYLQPGTFYQGNTQDPGDEDWYFLDVSQANANLVVSFIGDQANYMETSGWVIEIRDAQGNLLAAFDSSAKTSGNVQRSKNDPISLPLEPMTQASYLVHTLGNAGRYYVVVRSDDAGDGEGRAYHVAAMLSDSRLVAPNPDTNFHDVETESNDDRMHADPLRSGVAMFGAFGKRMVKIELPPQPAEYAYRYYYVGCDPLDVATIPAGLDNCECDLTQVTASGDIDPPNPNTGSQAVENACYAKYEQVSGGSSTSSWTYAYDYDDDWFVYTSGGNEQMEIQMCPLGECEFARVHLRVESAETGDVLVEGPIRPGDVFRFGAVDGGRYFIGLYPEPVNGPEVDPQTGVVTVDDLVGSYNFILRGTGLPPQGGE